MDAQEKKIDEYIRRRGIIHQKYPDIKEAPRSIADEYFNLSTLLVGLENVQTANWGMTETSDGFQVDTFLLKNYENALAVVKEAREKNSEYITKEEEEAFKFPEIDFEGLRSEMDGMKNLADWRNLDSKIMNLKSQPLPRETIKELNKISKEMCAISAERDLQEPEPEIIEGGQMPIVKESKFKQIYDGAKEKIRGMYEKIKHTLNRETHDKKMNNEKVNDTNEIE